jgi:hypothetical protein
MSEGYQLKLSNEEARVLKEAVSYCLSERPQEETNQQDYLILSEIDSLFRKHGA